MQDEIPAIFIDISTFVDISINVYKYIYKHILIGLQISEIYFSLKEGYYKIMKNI